MSENAHAAEMQSSGHQGPGERLQAARIEKGLTLEDVANKMHLSVGILSSLEQNNFEDITAPIFVKGYLRSYARIVNIAEDDIIQHYSGYCPDCDPPISSTSNTSADLNSDDSRVKWFTWLVIIGLAALLIIWWWNRYQQPAETLSLDTTESLETLKLATQETEKEPEITLSGTKQAANNPDSGNNDLQQQVTQDLASLHEELEQPDELPVQLAEPEITVEQPAEMAEKPITQDVSTPERVEEPKTEPEPAVTPSAGNKTTKDLVVTVNADTWIDIRDAAGNKLVYDLIRSGETVAVDGKAPLRAFFGNGYGVSMKYRGKEVDLSGVIKANKTAKINIGQ